MEIIATAEQTVSAEQDVLFTNVVTSGNCSIVHRNGSGLVTLRGITNQCRARYKVYFGGNLAVPTGGTVGAIQAVIALEGEGIASSTMIVTPAAVGEYFNASAAIFIDVPRGCCTNVSVKNTSDQSILVQNANLIIERVA